MESSLDLSKFWRWQKDCSDYGKKIVRETLVLKNDMGRITERFSKAEPVAIVLADSWNAVLRP